MKFNTGDKVVLVKDVDHEEPQGVGAAGIIVSAIPWRSREYQVDLFYPHPYRSDNGVLGQVTTLYCREEELQLLHEYKFMFGDRVEVLKDLTGQGKFIHEKGKIIDVNDHFTYRGIEYPIKILLDDGYTANFNREELLLIKSSIGEGVKTQTTESSTVNKPLAYEDLLREFKKGEYIRIEESPFCSPDTMYLLPDMFKPDNFMKEYQAIFLGDWSGTGTEETPKPKKFMATLKTIAAKLLDADTKALVEAGWLDEELDLTDEGEEAVLSFIVLANKEELAKEARKIIKDRKQK